jgi:tRNA pseudouridine55 synthase
VLNIDKPRDWTSHDVVDHVRRLTRIRRVGHAGTLDPLATGVLLLALGNGTKLTPFLHECPKTYRATLRLGVRTDSYDAAGKVIAVRAVEAIDRARVETALMAFRGPIAQVPPMYSALKRQGQRLYHLARQGLDVDRPSRRVHIFRLSLLDLSAETLSLEVECSSGTYIRVLADDIGTALGCGAHLATLVRTAIGSFRLAQALPLPALDDAARQGNWQRHVMALSAAVAAFPALVVTSATAQRLAHGMPPTRQGIARVVGTFQAKETVAIFSREGVLLAMGSATCSSAEWGQLRPDAPILQLRRVFRDSGSIAEGGGVGGNVL